MRYLEVRYERYRETQAGIEGEVRRMNQPIPDVCSLDEIFDSTV